MSVYDLEAVTTAIFISIYSQWQNGDDKVKTNRKVVHAGMQW